MTATESASSLARWSSGGAVAHVEAAPAGRLHRPLAGVDPAGLDALLGQQLEPLAPADRRGRPPARASRPRPRRRGTAAPRPSRRCATRAPRRRGPRRAARRWRRARRPCGRGGASGPCRRRGPGLPSARCPGGPAAPGPRPARPRPGARGAPSRSSSVSTWSARRATVDSRSSRVISAAASVACTRAVAPSTIRSARCTLRDSWSSAVASSFTRHRDALVERHLVGRDRPQRQHHRPLDLLASGRRRGCRCRPTRGPTPRRCGGGRRRSWAGSSTGRPRRRTARPRLLGRPPRRGSGRPRHGSRPTGRARSWAAASLPVTAAAEICPVASRPG